MAPRWMRRKPDWDRDDRDRDRPRSDRDRDRRESLRAGERTLTSATTTAPEPPHGAEDEDDMSAFFSSGHGSAMHYDRGSETPAEEHREERGA